MKQTHQVPVDGGELTVAEWGRPEDLAVLAVHGITANHVSWQALARTPGLRVIAPDLRGRAGSAGLPPPYGMAAHANDLAAVLDYLGIDQVPIVAGHSMGGFVTVVFAHRYPDRLSQALLVDGGLPLSPPEGIQPEQLLEAIIGPAAARLEMTFGSREQYAEFWRQHPALSDFTADVADYVDYDLIEVDGEFRPSGNLQAIRTDATSLAADADVVSGLNDPQVPMEFVRAPRGLMNELPGLYPPDQTRELGEYFGIPVADIEDTNHYTILLGDTGAGALATYIQGMVSTD